MNLDIIIPVCVGFGTSVLTYFATSKKHKFEHDTHLSKNYEDLIQRHEKRILELEKENRDLWKHKQKLLKIEQVLKILGEKPEFRYISDILKSD